MYLRRNPQETQSAVHGVDYHKSLEDGTVCNRVHEFNTVHCRPVLYMEPQSDSAQYIDYDGLSDREKLILGEPIFFGSSLHRSINKAKLVTHTDVTTYNAQGEKIENS